MMGVLFVAIPLAVTSVQVAHESIVEYQTRVLMKQWLKESSYEVNRIEADGNQVDIIISGYGAPPPLPELATNLQTKLDPQLKVRLRVVPIEILNYPQPDTE